MWVAAGLWGCATDSAVHAELKELQASLRALRLENGRIEARLDKLEQPGLGRRSAPPSEAVSQPMGSDAVPALTVVKLKPKAQAAPRLSTRVPVVEPPDGLVDELRADGRTSAEPDEADLAMAEAAYQKGLDSLKTGSVEGGIGQLRRFVEEWPKHPRADNALYFLGVALMAQQDFAAASRELERVTSSYPAGDAMLEAMLKLGECRVRLNQPQLAKATWEKIIVTFPGTAAASQATTRLASLPADPSKSLP